MESGQSRSSAVATPSTTPVQELRLLSLDGGAVRAFSQLLILRRIMALINSGSSEESALSPWQVFDVIGGTSTGGLIAIMLGKLRMDVDTAIQTFTDICPSIFNAIRTGLPISFNGRLKNRFDTRSFEEAIKMTIRSVTGSEDVRLEEDADGRPVTLVIAQSTIDGRHLTITSDRHLNSMTIGPEMASIKVWEAARATSAATTWFNPVQVGGRTLIDGGMGANNPVNYVLAAAQNKWPEARIRCLVSLGSGNIPPKALSTSVSRMLQDLVNMATDTERTAAEFLMSHREMALEGQYFRFSVARGLEIVHTNPADLEATVAATEAYCAEFQTQLLLQQCAERLKPSEPPEPLEAIVDTPVRGDVEATRPASRAKPPAPLPTRSSDDTLNLIASISSCLYADPELHILLSVGSKRVGPTRLHKNLQTLLRHMAAGLCNEANDGGVGNFLGLNADQVGDEVLRKMPPPPDPPGYTELASSSAIPATGTIVGTSTLEELISAQDAIDDVPECGHKFIPLDEKAVKQALETFHSESLRSSQSFRILREDLRRFFFPKVKSYVREMLLGSLPTVATSAIFTVSLQIYWELQAFMKGEYDSVDDLNDAFTLSGEIDDAQVAACATYVRQTWGENGLQFLEAIKYALKEGYSGTEFSSSHGVEIRVPDRENTSADTKTPIRDVPGLLLDITGSPSEIAENIELVGWLAAVFRFPPASGNLGLSQFEIRVVYSPHSQEMQWLDLRLLPIREYSSQDSPPKNGDCWVALLDSSVMAWGFPTRERDDFMGLEIPFDQMLRLSAVLFPTEFQESIVIRKGPLTIYPLKHSAEGTQWHLVNGSYADFFSEIEKLPVLRLRNEVHQAVQGRTFLGWASHAHVRLGTCKSTAAASGAEQDTSRGIQAGEEVQLKLNAKIPYFGQLGGDIKILLPRSKTQAIEGKRLGLKDWLNQSRQRSSIFYNCSTKTGWLIPELCLVLETSLARIQNAAPIMHKSWKSRYPALDYDSGKAALDFIVERQDDVVWDDWGEDEGGAYHFRDLVLFYLELIDSLKEAIRLRLEQKELSGAVSLRGWDFVDLQGANTLFGTRKVKPPRTFNPPKWWKLFKNPNIFVALGSNLGQVIAADRTRDRVCGRWAEVPCHQNLLVAPVRNVQQLCSQYGEQPHRYLLKQGKVALAWHSPERSRPFAQCIARDCNPVQELKEEGWFSGSITDPPLVLEGDGAVIFGDPDGKTLKLEMRQRHCGVLELIPEARGSILDWEMFTKIRAWIKAEPWFIFPFAGLLILGLATILG